MKPDGFLNTGNLAFTAPASGEATPEKCIGVPEKVMMVTTGKSGCCLFELIESVVVANNQENNQCAADADGQSQHVDQGKNLLRMKFLQAMMK
jgi:hypothetical protein